MKLKNITNEDQIYDQVSNQTQYPISFQFRKIVWNQVNFRIHLQLSQYLRQIEDQVYYQMWDYINET